MDHQPVSVHFIFPGRIPREMAAACLTDEEIARAGRFKFQKDAASWSACRAALREILGHALGLEPLDVPLMISDRGKPELGTPHERLHFNLSHCDGLALVVLSRIGRVGIDLEPRDRAKTLLECETSFCHPEEIAALPTEKEQRAGQLLRIWTAKEAVLKALGTGLSHPPESVRIHFQKDSGTATSDIPLAGIEHLGFRELSHPALEKFQAVVAMSGLQEIRYSEVRSSLY